MPTPETVTARVRELAQARGVTHEALARHLNVTLRTITNRMGRHDWSAYEVQLMASLFEVSTAVIMGEAAEKRKAS